jgi:hypothetical protein
MLRVTPFHFFKSLLHFRRGWGAKTFLEKLDPKNAEMLRTTPLGNAYNRNQTPIHFHAEP